MSHVAAHPSTESPHGPRRLQFHTSRQAPSDECGLVMPFSFTARFLQSGCVHASAAFARSTTPYSADAKIVQIACTFDNASVSTTHQ